MDIKKLKSLNIKFVILNGFIESIDYVLSLNKIKWTGETKSNDGYTIVQCYETL